MAPPGCQSWHGIGSGGRRGNLERRVWGKISRWLMCIARTWSNSRRSPPPTGPGATQRRHSQSTSPGRRARADHTLPHKPRELDSNKIHWRRGPFHGSYPGTPANLECRKYDETRRHSMAVVRSRILHEVRLSRTRRCSVSIQHTLVRNPECRCQSQLSATASRATSGRGWESSSRQVSPRVAALIRPTSGRRRHSACASPSGALEG